MWLKRDEEYLGIKIKTKWLNVLSSFNYLVFILVSLDILFIAVKNEFAKIFNTYNISTIQNICKMYGKNPKKIWKERIILWQFRG